MLEEKKKSDSYRKNFRVFNRQYSENNTGKSVFEHGRKGGQNFNRTSTKQRPLNLKLKKKKKLFQAEQINYFVQLEVSYIRSKNT